MCLNIKTDWIKNSDFASKIAALIHKYHLEEKVFVESFNPFFLISMRRTARDILLIYDFTTNTTAIGEENQARFDTIPWVLKQPFVQKQIRRIVRPDVLGPRFNIDKNLLTSLVSHGYPVITWTVDDPRTAQDLFDLGVKGMITNKPLDLLTTVSLAPQLIYDAGGTSAKSDTILPIKSVQDVVSAIAYAKENQQKITIAGRRHSMGGQALLDNAIQLNMLGLDSVVYNPETQTVTVGAGATWKKVQAILDPYDRSVKVMQSDNIFTVAGSISVNAHGWQVGSPPIGATVLAMTVVTADGKIRRLSKDQEPELFKAVIGGYGLFGVIVEAELETVLNATLAFHAQFMALTDFDKQFKAAVTDNPQVELAYGRLSVDLDHLFEEAGLFWYEKTPQPTSVKLLQESFVAFKRGIFRVSQYLDIGKKLRWSAEKIYAQKKSNAEPISRNNAMNADVHVLWPLYGSNKDILHEYFIPKQHLTEFIQTLKRHILRFDMNILNLTIREVLQDKISLLPYARQDVFGLVCFFSQLQTPQEEGKMERFTQRVINDAVFLGGTFYLPYRLHYTKAQLLKAYPSVIEWVEMKKKWDPNGLFDTKFFQYIEGLIKQ